MEPKLKSPEKGLFVFVAILSVYRLATIGTFSITPDEAYYWTWSRRLAVCYYDQPGMVAWVDWLFALPWARTTAFTLRMGAVVLSGLSVYLLYRLYLEYRREKWEAALFAMIFSVLPFSWLAGIVMIHDTALLPWLVASYWMIFRLARRDGRASDWFLLAVCLAGAMYAKLSAVMLSWGLILYMLYSPKGRRWWRTWPPYAAGALAVVLYLPVLWWNHENDWVLLSAVGELTDMKELAFLDRLRYFSEYVFGQIGMFAGLFGVIVFGALIKGLIRSLRAPADDETVLPVCLALPIFLYFMQLSFRSHVYGNWPSIGSVPVAMLGMREAALAMREGRNKSLFGSRSVVVGLAINFFVIVAGMLVIHGVTRPLFSAIEERFELKDRIDWRVDMDMRGWDAMVEVVENSREGEDFILARRYQVASMLEFLLPDQPFVECYNKGQRGNQWDLWSTLDERVGQDALFADTKLFPRRVREVFESYEPVVKPLVLGDPERPIKEIYVVECRNFKGP